MKIRIIEVPELHRVKDHWGNSSSTCRGCCFEYDSAFCSLDSNTSEGKKLKVNCTEKGIIYKVEIEQEGGE